MGVLSNVRLASPQPYVSSAKFVGHLCQQVVPGLSQLPSEEEALELLKLLAEMAPFACGLEDQDACLHVVFLKLLVRRGCKLAFFSLILLVSP